MVGDGYTGVLAVCWCPAGLMVTSVQSKVNHSAVDSFRPHTLVVHTLDQILP